MKEGKKVLLITGGSRGIGAACALLAADQGYHLAINYRKDLAAAEKVATAARAKGVAAQCYQADIADEAQVTAMTAAIAGSLGRVTHLINNAGIATRASRLDDADMQEVQRCVQVNVMGSLFVARAAIRHMATRHGGIGGAMVNLSSVAADLGGANEFVWYAASKAAIESMTIGLSKEVAGDGIRVNCVSPGLIDTEIHDTTLIENRAQKLAGHVPMQRVGTAAEVAEAALFLLSEKAAYVNGAVLRVSGGR